MRRALRGARGSVELADGDPSAAKLNLVRRPATGAWHRALLETAEDRVGVRSNVLDVPQIEGERHRLAVRRSKQVLDVLVEADRLSGGRYGHADLLVVRSGEPLDEVERRVGDVAPAVVDREGVASV